MNTLFLQSKKIIYSLVLTCVLVSCASTPKQDIPLWANEETLEEAFPSSKYIARIGKGKNVEEARVYASSELTRHFSHSVKTTTEAKKTFVSANGKATEKERILEQNIFVDSSMSLFAVHYTDSFYEKNSNSYIVCAYIDRKEAWNIFESKVKQAQKEFYSHYEEIKKENSLLRKISLLKECKENSNSYLNVLDFAHTLYSTGESSYSEDRNLIASLDTQLLNAKRELSFSINVKDDKDSRIQKNISRIFSECGLNVSNIANACKVNVFVEKNKTYHGTGEQGTITANPSVSIYILDGENPLFTYEKSLNRVTGFSQAEAFVENKIYSAIEDELNSSFREEINSFFN